MKTFLTFSFAMVAMSVISFAESPTVPPAQTETKTAATNKGPTTSAPAGGSEAVGTIVEFAPGGNLVLKTSATEPLRFKLAKGVRYLNAKGKDVSERKMKKDRKVRVHYLKQGEDMMVDKIQIEREGKRKKARK